MVETPIAKPRPAARRKVANDVPRRHLVADERAAMAPARVRNENDSLAAILGGEIIAGVYPPGSLLPHESVLLERFKVSRPTLREAFRALAAKGLISLAPEGRHQRARRNRSGTRWIPIFSPGICARR